MPEEILKEEPICEKASESELTITKNVEVSQTVSYSALTQKKKEIKKTLTRANERHAELIARLTAELDEINKYIAEAKKLGLVETIDNKAAAFSTLNQVLRAGNFKL